MKKIRFPALVMACLLCTGLALAEVNINTATRDQLDGLKGIGRAKAQAIIDYRRKNGPFRSVDDLHNVSGISPAMVEELRPDIMVSGSSRAAPPRAHQAGPKALPPPASPSRRESPRPAMPAKTVGDATSPARSATLPGANAPASPARPAMPAAPARPAMPGKATSDAAPVVPAAAAKAAAPARPAGPAVPARPAMPGKVSGDVAAPAAPAARPAAPAAPARPAAPAMPARPAAPN
jgi:competence protein ComEA